MMDWKRDDRNEWNSGRRLKKKRLDEKLKQRVRATFRATGKVMGSQITQQVALQVIGNDTARAWRSQSHRLNEGGVSTDYRPRPGAAPTAVMEDLASLPPVAASTSPSLRSATDTAAALLTRSPQRSWLSLCIKILTLVTARKNPLEYRHSKGFRIVAP